MPRYRILPGVQPHPGKWFDGTLSYDRQRVTGFVRTAGARPLGPYVYSIEELERIDP